MTGIWGKLFGTGKSQEITGRDMARIQMMAGPNNQITTGQVGGWGNPTQPQPGTTYFPISPTLPREYYQQPQKPKNVNRLSPETMAVILAAKDTIRDWLRDYFPAIVYANVHNLKNVYNFTTTSPRCDRDLAFIMILYTIMPEGHQKDLINRLRNEYEVILDLLYDSNYDFDSNRGASSFSAVNTLRRDPDLNKMKEDYDNLSGLDKVV